MPQSPSSSSSSEAERDYPPLPEPLEINWPELNSQALGCGVEDRGLRDRYQCAEYGWEDGVDRAIERVPEEIYDADQMRAYVDADRAARATPPSLPIDFKQASEQGGWIRVDERLPEIGPDEESIHVWTWDGVTVEHDEFVANYEQPAGPTVGGWVRTDDWFAGDIDNRVTHWQLYSKPAAPSPHPEEGALLLGGDEGGKKGGA